MGGKSHPVQLSRDAQSGECVTEWERVRFREGRRMSEGEKRNEKEDGSVVTT